MKIEKLKYKIGDQFRSKSHPYKDFKITFIDECCLYGKEDTHLDDEMTMLSWEVINLEEFNKMIFSKTGFQSIADATLNEKSIYPMKYCGDMTLKSFKSFLSKYDFKLKNI